MPTSSSAPTRTIKLTDRLNAFIEEAVASGRYFDDGTAPASAPLPAGATVPTPRRAA